MDKEGGREKGGWTDGRGYAWLKGTRWEEADLGVLCACARACVHELLEETPHFTSPHAKLIVETSLSLVSRSSFASFL